MTKPADPTPGASGPLRILGQAHGHSHGGHAHSHGGHGHAHGEHGHAHGHGEHGHGGPSAPVPRPELPPGAGQGKTLLLDTFSGIAGDMTIAALLDLGVPFSAVEGAVRALPLEGYRLVVAPTFAGAIGATRFDVLVERAQGERTYAAIDRLIEEAPLDPAVKALSRQIFRRLAEAESEVHRIPLDAVHFHEVGAVDAIVDIVGSAAAFVFLGARVIATPLPLGRGTVTCRHGVLPLPAPAALLCLRGVPTVPANIEAELVTPTGAAIVATVAEQFVEWPALVPEHVGWGAGTQQLPDRPNALRVVLGTPSEARETSPASHWVIEANVDDMTGELVGHVIATLLREGALDAWAVPVVMKKGRPGFTLSVLAEAGQVDRLASALLRESTSIGVRKTPVTRVERPRRMVEVETPYGAIPIKISEGPFGAPSIKPEFDACARAAERHGVSVREVIGAALLAASR